MTLTHVLRRGVLGVMISTLTAIKDMLVESNYNASLQLLRTHFHPEAIVKVYQYIVSQDTRMAKVDSTKEQLILSPLIIQTLSNIYTIFSHDVEAGLPPELATALDPLEVLDVYSKFFLMETTRIVPDTNPSAVCLDDRPSALQYYSFAIVNYFKAIEKFVRIP